MKIRKSMFQLVNAYASTVEGNELGTSVTFTDEKLATMLTEVEQRVARECAEICGEIASSKVGQHEGPRDTHVYEQGIGAEQCFSAIRARFLTGKEGKNG